MKKFLSIILAILMIVSSVPFAFAADGTVYTSGNYTYTLDENGEATLETYTGTEEDVTVPAVIDGYPVKELQNLLFENNSTMKNVVISEGIKYVVGSVFASCSALESASFPDSVLNLGYNSNVGAFNSCPNLKKVTIGKNLFALQGTEFRDCPNLEELIISEENPYYVVEDLVVYTKNKKTLVNYFDTSPKAFTVPDGVRVIGSEAFSYSGITEINFNDDLLYVPYFAFIGCDNLTKVVFPNSVNEFGIGIFSSCDSLTSVTFPENTVSITRTMFVECFNLKDVYVPAGTESVDAGTFYNWTYDLDELAVPEINFYFGGNETEWNALNVDTKDTAPNVFYNHTHEYNCTDTVSECAECGLSYSNSHAWKITEVVYPENGEDGYIELVCSTDNSHTKREVLSADAPLAERFYTLLEEISKIYLETDWIDSINSGLMEKYSSLISESLPYIYGEYYKIYSSLENSIQILQEAIETGEYIKPDYSEYDALIEEIEKALGSGQLFAETQANLDTIKTAVDLIRADGENTKYEYQATIDAYADELEVIKSAVTEGTAVKADYTEIDKIIEDIDTALKAATISGEMTTELADIKADLEQLKADENSSKADVDELLERANAITETMNNCANGVHKFENYTETTPATCLTNAKETATCSNGCGNSDTREIADSALGHDTESHAGQKATCNAKGWEAYETCSRCDYTTYKEIPVNKDAHTGNTEIKDAKEATATENGYTGDTYCKDCGAKLATGEVITATGTGDSDNNCDHLCHNNNWFVKNILWKIVRFIWKLFKINPVCDCGIAHY